MSYHHASRAIFVSWKSQYGSTPPHLVLLSLALRPVLAVKSIHARYPLASHAEKRGLYRVLPWLQCGSGGMLVGTTDACHRLAGARTRDASTGLSPHGTADEGAAVAAGHILRYLRLDALGTTALRAERET